MKRRNFIKNVGAGIGASFLPLSILASNINEDQLLKEAISNSIKKELADVGLNQSTSLGASYCDVRIGRYLNQFIFTRERNVQNIVNRESYGVGVRVIVDGTWGFASSNNVSIEGVSDAAKRAVAIARANSKIQLEPVQLAPVQGHGEVSWNTPIEKNAFEVSVQEKAQFLLDVNEKALTGGASFINSSLFFVNEQKYFASTDGSYIDQDIHRIWPTFRVTVVDPDQNKFKTRESFGSPVGMGFEYLNNEDGGKVSYPDGSFMYRNRYNMLEDIELATEQTKRKLSAKSVESGKYNLVLDSMNLGLTIHESVGHPLELDRVLGYEANYAGTSFATLDKWESKKFEYGSPVVNFVADKTQPTSLGEVGYDDEGVRAKEWDLVKSGILVNYQAIRDQAHIIGEKESHGCCYADSWESVQFQRMPNVSLVAGKDRYSAEEMIKDVENGIFIVGEGSYSIDQQRYNFQFGGQLFYEIKNGQIGDMLDDVAYQANTQTFWNACEQICDERYYGIYGTFFDGKGQPGQSSAVSHGASMARFKDVNIINTARNI